MPESSPISEKGLQQIFSGELPGKETGFLDVGSCYQFPSSPAENYSERRDLRMAFDVTIFTGKDGKEGIRTFQNVHLLIPQWNGDSEEVPQQKWITLLEKSGDMTTLNFRSWSVTEKMPDKVKVRKRDGKVIDDGYRVTGDFDRMTIYRRNSGKKSGGDE